MRRNVVVLGAGGFIGGHLVQRLVTEGSNVLAADIKPLRHWHTKPSPDVEVMEDFDAAEWEELRSISDVFSCPDEVYNLAADMGGIGFIEQNKTDCMLSVLISTNVLRAAAYYGWPRVFYSSSACVYPAQLQRDSDVVALRECDAYPADPEDGYGWEKLFSERMHRQFREDGAVETRVARYHNVYGPRGEWQGGREKAPAALCRKVAEAVVTGRHEIDVWGDGEQTRSFMYVSDCVEGTLRIMRSNVTEPINLGSSELVSVNQLITVIERIAGVTLDRRYQLDKPKGVRGRNSDNTFIRTQLGWEPSVSLYDGLVMTYAWVLEQVKNNYRNRKIK